jgi:hypothetical protein
MDNMILSLFKKLEQENIQYCLIRDGDRVDQFLEGGEIDLLVRPDQFPLFSKLLINFGFIRLPDWGHRPHHFFLSYDWKFDSWLKIDLITEITYGRYAHNLRTSLAEDCLNNRHHNGTTYVPSPEDELLTLLLHCVLDKGYFSPARKERLGELRQQGIDTNRVTSLLNIYWSPDMSWQILINRIDSGNWKAFLDEGEKVASYLVRGHRLGTAIHSIQSRILRKFNNWVGKFQIRGPLVALLAPDGAGKSTLANNIEKSFYLPVEIIYMGLYQKGDKVSGASFLPGSGLIKKLARQWMRYLTARYYQMRGRLVIFDRYTYDSFLVPQKDLNLVRRWRRWILAHACPSPDLVILLDAPGDLLYERKREHTAEFLEQQRRSYLDLRNEIPKLMVLDVQSDPDIVRRQATALIWQRYLCRSGIDRSQNPAEKPITLRLDKYLPIKSKKTIQDQIK